MLSITLSLNFKLFENYSHSSSMFYHQKIIGHILINKQQDERVCFYEIIQLIILKMEIKMKNRSNRYEINKPRCKHRHKYS